MQNNNLVKEKYEVSIIDFLKDKRNGSYIRSLGWWGVFRNRVYMYKLMKGGYISFSEFYKLLLPSFICPSKVKLLPHYHELLYKFTNQEAKKEIGDFILSNDNISLFGHDFGMSNYNELISLINEVIICDQYHIKQFLKKDSVIIDSGANVGMFAVYAANLAEFGSVYSFEPVKETFGSLIENTKDYKQIHCIHSGLGDVISSKNILVKGKDRGDNVFEDSPFFVDSKNDAGKLEQTKMITIDSFVAENNISKIDFIKIDTEGYEAKILVGAKEAIKKFKPIIAMSAYHNPGDKENLPRILKEICSDYTCELFKEYEEVFICHP